MAEVEKLVGLTITGIDIHKGAEDGTGFVYLDAIGADETPDIDDEIFDYTTSKPYIEDWSTKSSETTKAAGQAVSYGNVRAQHGAQGAHNAAGSICEPISFSDKQKRVSLNIKVVDADAITKVREGVYRGVSIRGRLVGNKWKDGKYDRYTVDPIEFSLVDQPANPNATITVVKADGSTEVMKADGKRTKRVAGKELGPESFAYVGDRERTETWKLPIHDASHVRNALARLDQTEGIPAEDKSKVEAKIRRAAKRFGIDAESLKKSADAGPSAGAGQIARVLDSYFFLRDTNVLEADQISEVLKTAVSILDDEENADELEEMIAMKTVKADEVEKQGSAEEVEKASAISKMKAARKAHNENGACVGGYCDHGDTEKCMEKVAENHKTIEEAFRADKKKSADKAEVAKGAKKDDEKEGEAAKKSEKEETEEEKKAREKKEAEDKEKAAKEEEEKKADKEKSAQADQIKALTAQVAQLTEIVTKAAEGKGFARPVPIYPGSRVVTKADDTHGEKDIVEKKGALDKNSPDYVDKAYQIDRATQPELVKL